MSVTAVLCNSCKAAITSQPPPEHCEGCGEPLWSTMNYIGERFHVGESIGFMSHIGFPCEGIVVQILTEGMSVLCRYKETTWRSSTYDEAHPLAEVAKSLRDLSTLLGKRTRYAPARLTAPKKEPVVKKPRKTPKKKEPAVADTDGVVAPTEDAVVADTVVDADGQGSSGAVDASTTSTSAAPCKKPKKPTSSPSHKLMGALASATNGSVDSAATDVKASPRPPQSSSKIKSDSKSDTTALLEIVPPNSSAAQSDIHDHDAFSLESHDAALDDLSDWIDDVQYTTTSTSSSSSSTTSDAKKVEAPVVNASQSSVSSTSGSGKKTAPVKGKVKPKQASFSLSELNDITEGEEAAAPPTRTLAKGTAPAVNRPKIIFKKSAMKKAAVTDAIVPEAPPDKPSSSSPSSSSTNNGTNTSSNTNTSASTNAKEESVSSEAKKLAWASIKRRKRPLDQSASNKLHDGTYHELLSNGYRGGKASPSVNLSQGSLNSDSEDDQYEDAMTHEDLLLQLERPRTWVTDFICDRIKPEVEYEHDSYSFSLQARFRSLDYSISEFSSVNRLLSRVRFVEGCTQPIHCGKSRLSRLQQRKLCVAIYNNTQPHRLRADANIALLLSGTVSSSSMDVSKNASTSGPVPLTHRSDLVECGSLLLTVSALERILWACPTTIEEMAAVPDLDVIATDPMAPSLLCIINAFLEDNGIDPRGDFQEIVRINSNVDKVFPVAQSDDPNCDDWTPTFFCPLCPSLKQFGSIPMHYSQEEFNAMKPTFPLSFEHFMYAINIVYGLFDGKKMVESHSGVKGVEITDTGHRTMYGSINENLTEELVQRSGMAARSRRFPMNSSIDMHGSSSSSSSSSSSNSSCSSKFPPDVFTDIGSGMGQVCIQVAATTGCRAFGYEIIKERFESSLTLLEHFSSVLSRAGIDVDFKSLVTFECADFVGVPEIARDSTVIFLNNFANWFVSDNPGKKIDYNAEFSKQLLGLRLYGQIFTLNRLISTGTWLPERSFEAPRKAVSWIKGEEKSVRVYHYIKDSDKWLCRVCGAITPNDKLDQCVNGHVPRAHRMGR